MQWRRCGDTVSYLGLQGSCHSVTRRIDKYSTRLQDLLDEWIVAHGPTGPTTDLLIR